MKFNHVILIFFSTVCIVGSCSDVSEEELEFRDYYAEGTADSNHLEKGLWKYFDLENHSLRQAGSFSLGLRNGIWHYYDTVQDSVFWLPYSNDKLALRTNIPNFFILDFEENGFISFRHKDSSKLLLLKIAFTKNNSFNSDDYNKIIRTEVNRNSIKVKSDKYLLINNTCNNSFNLNKFEGVDTLLKSYELLTINTLLDSNLVEVTVRSETNNRAVGEKIFYSVVSNLFIGNRRFFDANIDCEILRNKVVKTKQSFSFGCNNRNDN